MLSPVMASLSTLTLTVGLRGPTAAMCSEDGTRITFCAVRHVKYFDGETLIRAFSSVFRRISPIDIVDLF